MASIDITFIQVNDGKLATLTVNWYPTFKLAYLTFLPFLCDSQSTNSFTIIIASYQIIIVVQIFYVFTSIICL